MAKEVTCALCGKTAAVFGTHGLFTAFTKPLANWCPKCQMWICGYCQKWGGKCPRCKNKLT